MRYWLCQRPAGQTKAELRPVHHRPGVVLNKQSSSWSQPPGLMETGPRRERLPQQCQGTLWVCLLFQGQRRPVVADGRAAAGQAAAWALEPHEKVRLQMKVRENLSGHIYAAPPHRLPAKHLIKALCWSLSPSARSVWLPYGGAANQPLTGCVLVQITDVLMCLISAEWTWMRPPKPNVYVLRRASRNGLYS